MTLHIDITVNGTTIHRIAVVNEGPCFDGVQHRYIAEVWSDAAAALSVKGTCCTTATTAPQFSPPRC